MKIRKSVLPVFFGLLLLGFSAYASDVVPPSSAEKEGVGVSKPDLSAVDQVIKEQLEAIRERNDRIAYELNSQEIRDEYDDPQSFMRMIRRSKPSLYDHVAYEIMPVQVENPKFHKVKLKDKYGHSAMALFKMSQNQGGLWATDDIIVLSGKNDPL